MLFCIPKILKNESNSQHFPLSSQNKVCCFVSQRYWKMKAIHNIFNVLLNRENVVLYPKDTEKWKQFTTSRKREMMKQTLFCIPKILKNESNSQRKDSLQSFYNSCFVSQRYWKMKAIHNYIWDSASNSYVVLYPKDTEKWKQFTTRNLSIWLFTWLFCIPKILKNESNSQQVKFLIFLMHGCFVSQRYWKMKAIHNYEGF